MKPGIIYRLQWHTQPVVLPPESLGGLEDTIDPELITVDIEDTETLIDDFLDPEIISLQAADSPLVISTISNDEDKLTPIKAKQARVSFHSNTPAGIIASLFADASDRRYKVTVTTEAPETVFVGFVVSPDIQQPFLPDPVVITLTATDQLGLLKGNPLLDADDVNPIGKYRISEIIAMALRPTGLELQVKAAMNVRHGSGQFTTTTDTQFIASGSQIITQATQFFYAGQQFSVTGTASNDGDYNVIAVGQGIITIIGVSQSVTDETVAAGIVFTDETSGAHFYDYIYLDAKTFESNIGESEDCYTVLEKILGEDCILFQHKGAWHILRLDELDDNPLYTTTFDTNGDIIGTTETSNPTRSIGNGAEILHINRATGLRFGQPHKFIKETFKYVTPQEIVCNTDFSRGDVITPPVLTAGSSTGDYALDCWTLRRTSGSITSTAFIRRKFTYGVEEERYVVITPKSSGATPYDFIESQAVELVKNDKVSVGVSFRFENDIAGSGVYSYFLMKIYLLGSDGTWYYWWSTDDLDDPATYRWTSSSIETDRAIATSWNMGDIDETEWRTINVDLDALPVDGKLYIGLYQGRQGGDSSDNQNIYYQGLNLTYKPFINGSYQLFRGQYNKVSRLDNIDKYNATRDKEVYISDSPRKEFKGAMFFKDSNDNYQLTRGRFFAANVTALAPQTDQASIHPFGHLQAYSVWNQYRNTNRIFNATLLGFFRNLVREWPDIINKFQLSDENESTNYRYFLLVSFEQDWRSMKWSATLVEVFHQVIGHRYDDPLEFKYTV